MYPDNWDEIAHAVKEVAGWKCENCGAANSRAGWRILTVHHLDGDPSNCDPSNLVALCQRCHLSIQAKYYPGQLHLDHIPPPAWMLDRGLIFSSTVEDYD